MAILSSGRWGKQRFRLSPALRRRNGASPADRPGSEAGGGRAWSWGRLQKREGGGRTVPGGVGRPARILLSSLSTFFVDNDTIGPANRRVNPHPRRIVNEPGAGRS